VLFWGIGLVKGESVLQVSKLIVSRMDRKLVSRFLMISCISYRTLWKRSHETPLLIPDTYLPFPKQLLPKPRHKSSNQLKHKFNHWTSSLSSSRGLHTSQPRLFINRHHRRPCKSIIHRPRDNCKLPGRTSTIVAEEIITYGFPEIVVVTPSSEGLGFTGMVSRSIKTWNTELKIIVILPRSGEMVVWLGLVWLREGFRIWWLCCLRGLGVHLLLVLMWAGSWGGASRLRLLCRRWKMLPQEHCQSRS
jgi:hypothetical protein